MPSAKELAKALAYRGEIRNTPQNSFLGGVADFLAPVSEFADRDKLPGSIPLLGGMSFADLSGLKGAQSLIEDMSYGKSPVRGATLNTAKVDPRLLDLAAVSGAMIPVGKALGKAALREGARQIHTGTGVLGRNVIDPRQRMFAGEGAKTADKQALKIAKDMKAAGVPDEQIHAKTKWTFAFADGKPRFEIDDSAAKLRIMPRANQMLKAQTVDDFMAHPELLSAHPDLAKTDIRLSRSESGSKGAYLPEQNTIELAGLSDTAPYSMANDVKSTTLHELQHAIQQREGFARGGSPEMFKVHDDVINVRAQELDALSDGKEIRKIMDSNDLNAEQALKMFTDRFGRDPAQGAKLEAFENSVGELNALYNRGYRELTNMVNGNINSTQSYRNLAGEAEARLTQSRMNMTPAERAASYPPSMFDVPVKDQIVRYGDNVGGAMMQRPKTEFEILHDTAQRNAALPKEQGGLGLPEGNTYIDRANAPGMFPTDAYHATNVEFDSFDPSKTKFVNGVFSSTDPSGASAYVEAKNAGLPTKHEGGFVMPLRINNEKSVTPEYFNLNNIRSGLAEGNNVVGGDVVVIPDAKNIRSRFAAFDPMRRHEADILAGVGVGGMLDPQAIAEALRQQDRK